MPAGARHRDRQRPDGGRLIDHHQHRAVRCELAEDLPQLGFAGGQRRVGSRSPAGSKPTAWCSPLPAEPARRASHAQRTPSRSPRRPAEIPTMAERSTAPMVQAVVTDLMGSAEQVSAMAALRSVRNVGYSLGALIAAVCTGQLSILPCLRPTALSGARRTEPRGPADRDARHPTLGIRPSISRPHRAEWDPRAAQERPVSGTSDVGYRENRCAGRSSACPVAVNTVLAVALQMRFARDDGRPRRGMRTFRRPAAALVLCCVTLTAAGRRTNLPQWYCSLWPQFY